VRLEFTDDRVDVNVHPTKKEVRFVGERDLAERIRVLVRQALLEVPAAAELADRAPARGAAPPRERSTGNVRARDATVGAASVGPLRQRLLLPPTSPTDVRSVSARGPHPGLDLIGCVGAIYWVAQSEGGM